MAILKAAEADLKKQREMIEGLITRVMQYESRAEAPESPVPLGTPEEAVPVDLLKTGGMKAFDASRPDSVAAPVSTASTAKPAAKPAPRPAETPLISDDMFASVLKKPEAPAPAPAAKVPAFDPMATQKLPSGADQTQKMPPGVDRTQRMDASVESTQRMDKAPETTQRMPDAPKAPELPRSVESDKTMQIKKLDPNWKPEATQRMDINPPTMPLPGKEGELSPESTQRLDDSVWRLEEAKRILKGVKQKS
jgi:hypothetical protein